ncbi:unnamed protein product [Lymnaea stagnalis]|uniref:Monocarboxylate transporter n=1 Tax=Lymnaea stagnalis TaxID=6523 RepID=A0AAV2HWB3_LYMST
MAQFVKINSERQTPLPEPDFRPPSIAGHNSSHQGKRELSPDVLVLDSVQAWVVCFATFVILIISTTFSSTLNITFLQLTHLFGVTITSASLGFTLQLIALGLSSVLVTSIIIPKTGERVATVAGAVVSFVCTLAIGFAPGIAVYLVCMTIKGACTAVTTIPATSMISQYFDRRRSLATAAALGGIAIGSMGAPPFVKFFLETYGLRGTFLIIGGLEMNVISMGMLLRPTSRYKKIIKMEETSRSSDSGADMQMEETELEALMSVDDKTSRDLFSNKAPNVCIQNDTPLKDDRAAGPAELEALINSSVESEYDLDDTQLDTAKNVSAFSDGEGVILKTDLEDLTHGKLNSISEINCGMSTVFHDEIKIRDKMCNQTESINPISENSTEKYDIFHSSVLSESKDVLTQDSVNHCVEIASKSTTQISSARVANEIANAQYNSSTNQDPTNTARNERNQSRHVSSTWSVISLPLSDVILIVDIPAPLGKDSGPQNAVLKVLHWFYFAFNFKLFGLWTTRLLLLGQMSGSLIQYITTYLPTIAAKGGSNADEVALLLTVSGGVDFVSRLAVGYFTDLKLLSTSQVVAIAQFVIGTACHFTRFYTSAQTMMIMAVLLGVFGGTRQSLLTLVCLDFAGAERFVRAYGLTVMMSLLSVSVHHPLLSSLLEHTGSFSPPLHYVGVAAYLSCVCLLMEPLAKRLDSRRK